MIGHKIVKNLVKVCMFSLVVWHASASANAVTQAQWQTPLKNDQVSTTLASYKGKVVWIDFWASWCPPCKASFPWLNQMQQKYGSQGFNVVGINVDEDTHDAKTFLTQTRAHFDVYFDPDGNAPGSFQIQGMPTAILVDRNGQIRLFHVGFQEEQKAELEGIIRKALQ